MTVSAYYSASIFDFVTADSASIADQLPGERTQWRAKIALLKQQFNLLPHLAGDVILSLNHQAQTLDTVVLYRGLVFIVAIELDQRAYCQQKIDALLQQARWLKHSHNGSASRFIIPLYLAVNAPPQGSNIVVSEELVANTMCDNGTHLAALIEHFANQYKDDQIILCDWLASGYTTAE